MSENNTKEELNDEDKALVVRTALVGILATVLFGAFVAGVFIILATALM